MLDARSEIHRKGRVRIATFAIALLAATLLPLAAVAAESPTLDHIRTAGKVTLGYRADAQPFAYRDPAGAAAGYSVELCKSVAEQVKRDAGVPTLAVDWVAIPSEGGFGAVKDGKVDLLCGADSETLSKRSDVAFSIPIFAGGIGAMVRSDASFRLKEVLSKGQGAGPFWRASPAQILQKQTFAAVKGSPGERWVTGRLNTLEIDANVVGVGSYDAGVRSVLDRTASVFFADRAMLLDAAKRSPSPRDLVVLDRRFTVEPIALVMRRGDEDFRLLVDRALSKLLASDAFRTLYAKSFGVPDEFVGNFFRMNALPE